MNLSLLAVVTEYPAAVRKIKDAVEARLKAWFEEHQEGNSDLPLPLSRLEFNSVLLNRYRGGEDSQGWHSDNEAVYGRDPVIASVSFGCEREFCFRHCKDHKRKRSLVLEHGSLLLMFGPIQHHWQHCLPKRKKVQGERINLTFRQEAAVVYQEAVPGDRDRGIKSFVGDRDSGRDSGSRKGQSMIEAQELKIKAQDGMLQSAKELTIELRGRARGEAGGDVGRSNVMSGRAVITQNKEPPPSAVEVPFLFHFGAVFDSLIAVQLRKPEHSDLLHQLLGEPMRDVFAQKCQQILEQVLSLFLLSRSVQIRSADASPHILGPWLRGLADLFQARQAVLYVARAPGELVARAATANAVFMAKASAAEEAWKQQKTLNLSKRCEKIWAPGEPILCVPVINTKVAASGGNDDKDKAPDNIKAPVEAASLDEKELRAEREKFRQEALRVLDECAAQEETLRKFDQDAARAKYETVLPALGSDSVGGGHNTSAKSKPKEKLCGLF
eukprot:g6006.t1